MRWSATQDQSFGASGAQDPWAGTDRDDIDPSMHRGAPDWGLVALLTGYGALIAGAMLLIF